MNTICCRVAQIAFVCAVLSLVGLEAQAQTYVFGNASYSAPGLSSASSLVIADFNADGIPDAAMLGTISSGQVLSIFLGKPDGSFGPRVDYSVQASGFTVGDFNGDGKVDVVVVSSTGTSIFFGNGDGTLQPPVSLNQNLGSGYSAAASGDFNGDGKLDLLLLTPDFGSGATIAILLGNGDGTFQAPVTYSVQIAPYLVLGDFNGDGKLDLAVTNSEGSTNAVAIVLGNADGTLQNPPLLYSAGLLPTGLVTLDVNGDGKPDLAVAGGYGVLSYFSLTTLINRG